MNQLISKIEAAGTIALFGHTNPDGDCIGSCLGLYNYISDNYPEKQVVVYLEPIPRKFWFLKGAERIISTPEDKRYDLAISLDCGDLARHGAFGDIFLAATDTVCMDHHKSNKGFGDYFCCVPDVSSTCEVIFEHLDAERISLACAEALYLGIVHDTGVFKFPCTGSRTMCIAGALLEKGVDSQKIIDDTFFRVTLPQNKLTGEALLHAELSLDGRMISTLVTKEMFQRHGAVKADTDGIVDKLRVTEGCEVACFVYQTGEASYKFSLRSIQRVDVSEIAVAFGGGGHARAAGFNGTGDIGELMKQVTDMVRERL